MESILQVIQDRRSLRRFDSRPVDRETILTCIEAARLAPSAENVQPWRFVVLDDPDVRAEFGETVFSGIYRPTRWALGAPVLIVLLANLDFVAHRVAKALQKIPFYLLDVGIAGEHLALQAQSMGLGTCWIGWFDVKKASNVLKLPRNVKVCGIMTLGYPAEGWSPNPKRRRSLDAITMFNGWKSNRD